MTGKRVRQKRDGYLHREETERVIQITGTQSLRMYTGRRQATVAEWVAIRPIFVVFVHENMGYAGGERQREPWWRQSSADAQMRNTLRVNLTEEK